MFNRKAYSKKDMEIMSLTYFLIGSFLILGNLIVFFTEGGSWTLSLSAFTGIMFILTGNIYRLKAKKDQE
jgi:hypothetical protein